MTELRYFCVSPEQVIEILAKNNFDYLSNSNIGVSRQNTGKVFCTTGG
ncbi:MAG: hypothetical protein RMY62_030560 [Nostoc sp. ZfuVER08]|jgi:hypothetical protein